MALKIVVGWALFVIIAAFISKRRRLSHRLGTIMWLGIGGLLVTGGCSMIGQAATHVGPAVINYDIFEKLESESQVKRNYYTNGAFMIACGLFAGTAPFWGRKDFAKSRTAGQHRRMDIEGFDFQPIRILARIDDDFGACDMIVLKDRRHFIVLDWIRTHDGDLPSLVIQIQPRNLSPYSLESHPDCKLVLNGQVHRRDAMPLPSE